MSDLFIENYLKSLDLFNRAKSFIQKKKLDIAKLSLEKALIIFPSEYIPSDKKELFQLKRNILSTLKLTYKKSRYQKGKGLFKIKLADGSIKVRKYIYLTFILLIIFLFLFSSSFKEKGEKYFKSLLETSNLYQQKKLSKNNFKNVGLTDKIIERQRSALENKGIEIQNFNIYRNSKGEVIEIDVVYKDGISKTKFVLGILNTIEYYPDLQEIIINLRESSGRLLNSVKVKNNIYKSYKDGKISMWDFIDKWEIINL